jgi:hypothetical protein
MKDYTKNKEQKEGKTQYPNFFWQELIGYRCGEGWRLRKEKKKEVLRPFCAPIVVAPMHRLTPRHHRHICRM